MVGFSSSIILPVWEKRPSNDVSENLARRPYRALGSEYMPRNALGNPQSMFPGEHYVLVPGIPGAARVQKESTGHLRHE